MASFLGFLKFMAPAENLQCGYVYITQCMSNLDFTCDSYCTVPTVGNIQYIHGLQIGNINLEK